MDVTVREIINRPNNSVFTTEEMEYVVEQYILARKNRKVKIDTRMNLTGVRLIDSVIYVDEIEKLINAFNIACGWFMNNKN